MRNIQAGAERQRAGCLGWIESQQWNLTHDADGESFQIHLSNYLADLALSSSGVFDTRFSQ